MKTEKYIFLYLCLWTDGCIHPVFILTTSIIIFLYSIFIVYLYIYLCNCYFSRGNNSYNLYVKNLEYHISLNRRPLCLVAPPRIVVASPKYSIVCNSSPFRIVASPRCKHVASSPNNLHLWTFRFSAHQVPWSLIFLILLDGFHPHCWATFRPS